MSKSKYQIKKVRRVLKLKSNEFESATYNVWKVTGPKRFTKYFVTRKDAQAYVKRVTDNTITTDILIDVMRGR